MNGSLRLAHTTFFLMAIRVGKTDSQVVGLQLCDQPRETAGSDAVLGAGDEGDVESRQFKASNGWLDR